MIAVGNFRTIGNVSADYIATYDGLAWRRFDAVGPGAAVPAACVLDKDTALPRFAAVQRTNVRLWNGSAWSSASNRPLNADIATALAHDPDADGPLSDELIVGGAFTASGSAPILGVARLTGTDWQQIGAGIAGNVRSIISWDPDGPGPLGNHIVAAARFNAESLSRTFLWDGSSWTQMGEAFSGTVNRVYASPLTNEPSGAPTLYAIGSFASIGSTTATNIVRWDGTAWVPVAEGLVGELTCIIVTNDPTGDGSPSVFVGGEFGSSSENRVYKLVEGTWEWVEPRVSRKPTCLFSCDPDADGPASRRLYCATSNSNGASGAGVVPVIFQREPNGRWNTLATTLNGRVYQAVEWDEDGPGGAPPLIVACGDFTRVGGDGNSIPGAAAAGIAAWTGHNWVSYSQGIAALVSSDAWYQIAVFDRDRSGPASPQLFVAADSFFFPRSALCVRGPAAWLACGQSNGRISSMHVWDRTGESPVLVCAGDFSATLPAGGTALRIAVWDGSEWRSVGTSPTTYITSVGSWDPDGPGPIANRLVLAGNFAVPGGGTLPAVAEWDGTSWNMLPGFFSGTSLSTTGQTFINTMCEWDPDGNGPLTPVLVVGGNFRTVAGNTARCIATWNGQSWQELGGGVSGSGGDVFGYPPGGYVLNLTTWDADGSGPLAPELVAAGNFLRAGSTNVIDANRIARWNGSRWATFGTATDSTLLSGQAVFSAQSLPTSGQPDRLLIAGDFTRIDGLGSLNLALFGCERSVCFADFNADGSVGVNDIFEYVAAWFTSASRADFNASDTITLQDIFDFLTAWFQGC